MVGDLIRQKRIEKGLTQQKLGELLGYKGRSAECVVQHWEYNKHPVPMVRLKPLAKILEIPLEDLLP